MPGVLQDTIGVEISWISNIELAESQAIVFFNAGGYDLNFTMV